MRAIRRPVADQRRARHDHHPICPALRGLSGQHRQRRMAASESVDTRPEVPAGGAPAGGAPAARKGRRRLVMRRVGNGVMFVGLAVGVYALLPRLVAYLRLRLSHKKADRAPLSTTSSG